MNKLMNKKYKTAMDFFVNAPESERLEIIRKAAQMANRDQRETVRKAELIRKKAHKSK